MVQTPAVMVLRRNPAKQEALRRLEVFYLLQVVRAAVVAMLVPAHQLQAEQVERGLLAAAAVRALMAAQVAQVNSAAAVVAVMDASLTVRHGLIHMEMVATAAMAEHTAAVVAAAAVIAARRGLVEHMVVPVEREAVVAQLAVQEQMGQTQPRYQMSNLLALVKVVQAAGRLP